jgi:spermidine/putrescine transport system permease protein
MKKNSQPLLIYLFIYLGFLYAPVVLLPLFAFNDSAIIAFPLSGFTTDWFSWLMEDESLFRALKNSVLIAVTASFISTIFGVLTARAMARHRFFGKQSMFGLIMAPLFLPEIIVGVSILIVLMQLGLALSLWTVIAGHVLLATPFSVSILTTAFNNLDRSLEEASLDLGENRIGTFFRVILPLVTPGLISSLLIGFTISLDEFVIAFFLTGTDPTLPVYIWSLLRFPSKLPVVMALGFILLVASLVLLSIFEFYRRRSESLASGKENSGIK